MASQIITKIKHTKKNVELFFNNKTSIKLTNDVLTSHPLFIGKVIDEKTINELKRNSKEEDLFSLAIKKIKNSNMSVKKLSDYLFDNGASKSSVTNIIKRLREINLLDEESILSEIKSKAEYKHYGHNWIINKAKDLKVSSNLINSLKYDEQREYNEAKSYLDSIAHKYDHKNNFQRRKSIYNSLLRNGFSNKISLELVNNISNSNDSHELNVLKLDYIKAYGIYQRKYSGNELSKRLVNCLLAKGYALEDIKYVEELNK